MYIEYIIKPDAVNGFRTIIWKGDRSLSPEKINFAVDIRDGKPELKTKDTSGKWVVFSTRTAVIKKGRWAHVVITYKDGLCNIYVNGKKELPVRSNPGKVNKLVTNKADVFIGAGENLSSKAFFFKGLIESVIVKKGTKVKFGENFSKEFDKKINKYSKQIALFKRQQSKLKK